MGANFADKTGGQAALAGLLGVANNAATIQATLTNKCQAATEATVAFGEITYKGRQFDKAFFDGETSWNEQVENDGKYVLTQDAGLQVRPRCRCCHYCIRVAWK